MEDFFGGKFFLFLGLGLKSAQGYAILHYSKNIFTPWYAHVRVHNMGKNILTF